MYFIHEGGTVDFGDGEGVVFKESRKRGWNSGIFGVLRVHGYVRCDSMMKKGVSPVEAGD